MYSGTTYYNRAKYYEIIYGFLDQDGDDTALFDDKTDTDENYIFDDDEAELWSGTSRASADYHYRVFGLDSLDLVQPSNPADPGDTDDDTKTDGSEGFILDLSLWLDT